MPCPASSVSLEIGISSSLEVYVLSLTIMPIKPQSSQRSGDKNRQGQGRPSAWDPSSSSVPEEENILDPNAPKLQIRQFGPTQIQVPQQQVIFNQFEEYSSIQGGGGDHSSHSRLSGYTAGPSLNRFQGTMPQSYHGQGPEGIHFQPIPQSYPQPFRSLQFQTDETPPPTNVSRELATSPWGEVISPQWSWQSNAASSPSSQVSTPQPTRQWGALSPPTMPNPNRPQSSIYMQVPHTLLPSNDNLRRGTLAYNHMCPPSRSRGSLSRGELSTLPTVSYELL